MIRTLSPCPVAVELARLKAISSCRTQHHISEPLFSLQCSRSTASVHLKLEGAAAKEGVASYLPAEGDGAVLAGVELLGVGACAATNGLRQVSQAVVELAQVRGDGRLGHAPQARAAHPERRIGEQEVRGDLCVDGWRRYKHGVVGLT